MFKAKYLVILLLFFFFLLTPIEACANDTYCVDCRFYVTGFGPQGFEGYFLCGMCTGNKEN